MIVITIMIVIMTIMSPSAHDYSCVCKDDADTRFEYTYM